jgi:cell wall-active antibiotic response 4TMS protein YvqF
MKCAVHPEVDATGYCRNCGKAVCAVCVRPVHDVFYCEDCLATVLGHAAPAPAAAQAAAFAPAGATVTAPQARVPWSGSPTVAFLLGFLPGFGAFYNEQYGKGMIYLSIFLVLFITGVNGDLGGGAEAALWICVAGLWVYMPIDAYRTAKAKLAGQVLSDPLESWSKNRPVGPIILIVLGALFLLHNFDWFPFYRLERFWPLVLIAVGVLMFRNRFSGRW